MSYQEIIDNAVEQSVDKAEKIANYVLQKYTEENNPQLNSETNYGSYILIGAGVAVAVIIATAVISIKKYNVENHIKTSSTEYNNIPMQDFTSVNSEEASIIGEQSALI